MDQKEIANRAAQQFQTADGKIVDVLYGTSNGEMYYTPEEAGEAAGKLVNKTVFPFYRDGEVRKLARKYDVIQQMVIVTDFIKAHKARRTTPLYPDYVVVTARYKVPPVTDEIFKFVFSKVYTTRKLQVAGQMDTIYIYEKGIVKATFLRRYEQGQLWQYMDRLILTCPTNTELMGISYFTIFEMVLGPDPNRMEQTVRTSGL